MVGILWIVAGIALVVLSFADLVNSLISTSTSMWRWWPTIIVGRWTFAIARWPATRWGSDSKIGSVPLMIFAPILLLLLLGMWTTMQIVGFGMIWWGLAGIEAIPHLGTAIYYSGVVFLTVGFGDIVPNTPIERALTIVEALFGVASVALVVGYLPTIYGAYSERERALMMLDAGSNERITPTDLIMAWAPDANPDRLNERFIVWEQWAASILETHTTAPLLMYMRSTNPRQSWVTALGLLSDAAMQAQIISGASNGASYWFLRRAEEIFNALTAGLDVTAYQSAFAEEMEANEGLIDDLYQQLRDHGFDVYPLETSIGYLFETRSAWSPQMECLIDHLVAPRGFWPLPSRIDRIDTVAQERGFRPGAS